MATRVSQAGSSLDWIFQPLNSYIVNPLTDLVTNRLALPALKKAYSLFENSTVPIVRRVSPQAADWLAERLADPLSTETLLTLGQGAQEWSLQWGNRQPNPLPGAGYLDLCSIIAARHLYIFASDMKVILSAPRELRIKTEAVFTAAREETVSLTEKPPVKSGLSRVNIKETVASTLSRFQRETYDALSKQEKATRQKIVQRGAEFFCSGVISSSVRTSAKVVIAIGCYHALGGTAIVLTPFLSEELMEMARTITKTASAGIMSGGGLLFLRCTKTINNFFSATQAFEVSSSPLRDLAPTVGQKNIDQIIENIHNELHPFVSDESLLTPFVERAKKYSIELKFEDGSRVFAHNPVSLSGIV